MEFLYLDVKKPYWIDESLEWRVDLWETYVNESINKGKKMWTANIRDLLDMCDNISEKKQKLEIIIVMYAINLDNKNCCKLQGKYWETINKKINELNFETNYEYQNMFQQLQKELNSSDKNNVYNCVEEYIFNYSNNKFDVTNCYYVN
jgi:hypothetical protein